jgi:hypothetical protein
MKIKYEFNVTVHGWDGKAYALKLSAYNIDDALQQAVYLHGNKSVYIITVPDRHPYVMKMQETNWKV